MIEYNEIADVISAQAATPAPAAAASAAPAPAPAAPSPVAPAPPAAPAAEGRVYASPMARRLAELRNIRLGGKGLDQMHPRP